MLSALLVVTTLAGLYGHPELLALDEEIAALRAERNALRTYSDMPRRDVVDRQIELLNRVRERSVYVMDQRISRCMQTAPMVTPVVGQGPVQVTTACYGAANGVVGIVRRVAELRALAATKRTWADRDERDALEAEASGLEQMLYR